MKTQLICGVQNIIAIDLVKKETFQQKRHSLTNAEFLSQNFENKTQNNNVYLEIINDVAKAMDILDNVSAKVVKLMPSSEIKKEPVQDVLSTQTTNNNQSGQEIVNQELQPFAPSKNIFDVSQGPNH